MCAIAKMKEVRIRCRVFHVSRAGMVNVNDVPLPEQGIYAVHLVLIFYSPQYTDTAQLVIVVDKTSTIYMNPLKYSKAVQQFETLTCPHKFLKYFTD
jgi:hypothetical protein